MDRNPNTLEYFGIYESEGDRYLVLELINGSLSQYFKSNKNLSIDRLMKL